MVGGKKATKSANIKNGQKDREKEQRLCGSNKEKEREIIIEGER